MVEVTEALGRTGVVPAGEYSAAKTYNFLDLVFAAPSSYISRKDNNTGHPVTDPEWWQLSLDGSQSESAAEAARQAARGADASAKKADAAAKAVLELPVVRTDMAQTLTAEAQTQARGNISAVGALPVALTLGRDNALTVASPLDTLTSHYRLYAALPGAYRWSVVISDASGAQVEETEAEVIPTEGVLHLAFRSVVLGQRYDLALSLAQGAVTAASVAPWLRDRQTGADTSAGRFGAFATDIGKYDGNRGVEAFFRTGSDVSTRQTIHSNSPIEILVVYETLYARIYGVLAASYAVRPDTDYHVVAAFDNDRLEVSLYVDGQLVSSNPRDYVAPSYSGSIYIGSNQLSTGGLPFLGLVHHIRLFNYAPGASEVALLYNHGNPAGYVVPGEMRGGGNSYMSDFTAGPDDWEASNGDMTVAWSSGCLTASSTSTDVNVYRTFTKAAIAFRMPHAYAFEVVIEGSPQFSQMLFFPFSWRDSAAFVQSDAEIIDGGIRLCGHVATGLFVPTCYCYFYGVPVGTILRIKSIRVTPLNCIAEYLPQNVTPAVWYDSSRQLPVNGDLPPLWGPAGGYDLRANGSPRIVYRGEPDNAEAVAEVLAQSENSLEARIASLERALVSLTSGRTYIPKLTVRELEVWGANNLILTGEGAPVKSPDRAGQIYIDTTNKTVYYSAGNAAVSDWKNL